MAVYALADYARATKELAPDYTLTVDLGGRVSRVYTVNHDNALFFDNQFVVPDELLRDRRPDADHHEARAGRLLLRRLYALLLAGGADRRHRQRDLRQAALLPAGPNHRLRAAARLSRSTWSGPIRS